MDYNDKNKERLEALIRKLVNKFGTPNSYPSAEQVEEILREISQYDQAQKSDAIYRSIIKRYISYSEEYVVESYDLSDVNNTLDEILDILKDK